MSRVRAMRAAGSLPWLALGACAKLVGITDTEVTREDSLQDTNLQGMGGTSGAPTQPPPATPADAGVRTDAEGVACAEPAARCGTAGREVCNSGVWQAGPCPVNQPSCEADGQCALRGPALVAVGDFFVDATEVTVGQYGLFLAAQGGDTSGQSELCSWNQSYYEGPVVMDPSEFPMTSVDWCDASAYCAWAGKHLCGQIGGGAIARADIFNASLNQWYVACGGPLGGTHPNGNAVCNSNGGFDSLAPVATFPECEGYFAGLFDLEGNAAEWIDSCNGTTGPADVCYLMGGSSFDNRSYCDEVYEDETTPYRRDSTAVSFGFRCCAG